MSDSDRSKLQSLYPEPQKRSGMDARQPTKFSVPVVRLSLLLFFPIFFTIAIYSVQMYGNYDYSTFAINFIAIFAFVILSVLASIIMLLYARSIIARNCSRRWIINGFYLLIVVPCGVLLLINARTWFNNMSLGELFIIEAVVLYGLALVNTLIARRLTH